MGVHNPIVFSNNGHRSRLRERFLKSGFSGLLDYEIIELLLTLGTPRKDCKAQAKIALKVFGSLNGVLNAPLPELIKINGIGVSNSIGIQLFKSLFEKYKEGIVAQSKSFNSIKEIGEYLIEKIGKYTVEHFVILFFDTKNKLLFNDISVGTINASIVHPREVFNKAIEVHANSIIIAHNHPSGDMEPSSDDLTTTFRLIEAGKIIGIKVVDHIIVTTQSYISLRQNNLLNI